jgi:hypothetical protein
MHGYPTVSTGWRHCPRVGDTVHGLETLSTGWRHCPRVGDTVHGLETLSTGYSLRKMYHKQFVSSASTLSVSRLLGHCLFFVTWSSQRHFCSLSTEESSIIVSPVTKNGVFSRSFSGSLALPPTLHLSCKLGPETLGNCFFWGANRPNPGHWK